MGTVSTLYLRRNCRPYNTSEGILKIPERQTDHPKLFSLETKNTCVPGACSRNNLLLTSDHLLSIFASHFSSSPYHP